jgi:hypothetical protein
MVVVVIHPQAKEHLRIKTTRNVIQVRTIRMLTNVNSHHQRVVVVELTKRKGADQEMIINPMINVVHLAVTVVPAPLLQLLLLAMVVVDNQKIEVNIIRLHRVLNKEEMRQDIKHDLPDNKKIKIHPRTTKTTTIITTTTHNDD